MKKLKLSSLSMFLIHFLFVLGSLMSTGMPATAQFNSWGSGNSDRTLDQEFRSLFKEADQLIGDVSEQEEKGNISSAIYLAKQLLSVQEQITRNRQIRFKKSVFINRRLWTVLELLVRLERKNGNNTQSKRYYERLLDELRQFKSEGHWFHCMGKIDETPSA